MIAGSSPGRAKSIEELIPSALASRLDRLDVLSRKVFAGKLQGERRSKQRGQSVEFEDYRLYVPGDDLRHIDWNVFARLDRFFIKIFLEEQDLGVHVALDASASMDAGTPSKLGFAQRLAMALGYVALVNNNRVSASILTGESLLRLAPMRGRRNIERLGRFLIDGVAPRAEEERGPWGVVRGVDFSGALRAIASARTGKGVMVLLSDVLIREGYEEGLRWLAGGGYDTYLLQILSPGELDPSKEGEGVIVGDLRLVDAETGRPAEVTVTADMLKRYRQNVERYTALVRDYCASRGMAYALVPSDTDLPTLLLDYLRRRGLLR